MNRTAAGRWTAAVTAFLFFVAACSSEDAAIDTTPAAEPTSTVVGPQTEAPGPTPEEPTPDGDDDMTQPPEVAGELEGGTVVVSYTGEGFPTELTGIINLAKTDLAARRSVEPSAIAVASVEEVVWSNASLGCPLPGMSYAQVSTDGLRIVLTLDGENFDYRSGGLGEPSLCEAVSK